MAVCGSAATLFLASPQLQFKPTSFRVAGLAVKESHIASTNWSNIRKRCGTLAPYKAKLLRGEHSEPDLIQLH